MAAFLNVVLGEVAEIGGVDDGFFGGAQVAEETVGVDEAVKTEAGSHLLRVVVS